MQNLAQLAQIYNTLCTISTKGEDTINMALCLQALKAYLQNAQQEMAQNNVEGE